MAFKNKHFKKFHTEIFPKIYSYIRENDFENVEIEYRLRHRNRQLTGNELTFFYDKFPDVFLDYRTKQESKTISYITKNGKYEVDSKGKCLHIVKDKGLKFEGEPFNLGYVLNCRKEITTEVDKKEIENIEKFDSIYIKNRISIKTRNRAWGYDFTWIKYYSNKNFKFNPSMLELNLDGHDINGVLETEYIGDLNDFTVMTLAGQFIALNKLFFSFKENIFMRNNEKFVKYDITNLMKLNLFNNLFNSLSAKFDYLTQENLEKVMKIPAYYTLKLDGAHGYLFINKKLECYHIDGTREIRSVKLGNKHHEFRASNNFKNSLFEVEKVGKIMYFIQVLRYKNEIYYKKDYESNFDVIDNDVYKEFNNQRGVIVNGIIDNEDIIFRRHRGIKDLVDLKAFYESSTKITNDGILICPLEGLYHKSTAYKWKPMEDQTIEFMVLIDKTNGKYYLNLVTFVSCNKLKNLDSQEPIDLKLLEKHLSYCCPKLKLTENCATLFKTKLVRYPIVVLGISTINEFKGIEFNKETDLYQFNNIHGGHKIFDGAIVECSFNKKKKRFDINKIRYDKTKSNLLSIKRTGKLAHANALHMVEKIYNNINNPVSLDDLIIE